MVLQASRGTREYLYICHTLSRPVTRDSSSEDHSMLNGGESNGHQLYDKDVCRDFMRNTCTRGSRCKYKHPHVDDRSDSSAPRRELTFCHDYQNSGCTRPMCKFLHCSRDEEETFYRTGLLPSRLNQPSARGSFRLDNAPMCRDYLHGECKRGSKCKYRHSDDRLYENSLPELKRRRLDDDYDLIPGRITCSLLEDENATLKRRVEELKKQVTDLTAINEVLLEQNARYRVSKTTTIQVVSPPTVSQQAVAVAGTVTHAQATMQLNPSLTQQVALNSDLATQHALQAQRLQAATPMAAPTLTPAVTITNMGGPMAYTQSNLAVSMAPLGPAPQLQVAHSLTQNLGAPSTSLVSYPIMSQNMRSAVEPSSLTH